MSTLTIPNSFTSGTIINSTNVNANFTAVANVVNGGLDTSNLSASAGLVGTQFANSTVGVTQLSTNLKVGLLQLDLFGARELSAGAIQNTAANGGLLASDTTPTLTISSNAPVITWAAGNADVLQFAPVSKPDYFDDTTTARVHILASKAGSTDSVAFTITAYDSSDFTDDIGGNTSNLAHSASQQELTVTLAAADLEAAPGYISVKINPGAHATDAVSIYAAWIEYTRKS